MSRSELEADCAGYRVPINVENSQMAKDWKRSPNFRLTTRKMDVVRRVLAIRGNLDNRDPKIAFCAKRL